MITQCKNTPYPILSHTIRQHAQIKNLKKKGNTLEPVFGPHGK